MLVWSRHKFGEAQVEILTAEQVFPVILDERIHTGEMQVFCEEIDSVTSFYAGTDSTMLNSSAAPAKTTQ